MEWDFLLYAQCFGSFLQHCLQLLPFNRFKIKIDWWNVWNSFSRTILFRLYQFFFRRQRALNRFIERKKNICKQYVYLVHQGKKSRLYSVIEKLSNKRKKKKNEIVFIFPHEWDWYDYESVSYRMKDLWVKSIFHMSARYDKYWDAFKHIGCYM